MVPRSRDGIGSLDLRVGNKMLGRTEGDDDSFALELGMDIGVCSGAHDIRVGYKNSIGQPTEVVGGLSVARRDSIAAMLASLLRY